MMNEDLEKKIKMQILEKLMGEMDESGYADKASMMMPKDDVSGLPDELQSKMAGLDGQKMEENAMPDQDNVAGQSSEAEAAGDEVPASISDGDGDEDANYMGSRIMQKIKAKKAMMMKG